MKLRSILLDLDDTIIDRRLTLAKYANGFAADFNHALEKISMESLNSIIQETDCKGYKKREDFFVDLINALPWSKPMQIEKLSSHWFSHYPSSSVATVGLFDVLSRLTSMGIILGVVTNGSHSVQNAKIDFIGFREFMRTVVVSEAVGIKKPDKRIFHMALQDLNMAPSEVWFVGDHPINDVVGAASAGIAPVWFKGKQQWSDEHAKPSMQIESLHELLPFVERYG